MVDSYREEVEVSSSQMHDNAIQTTAVKEKEMLLGVTQIIPQVHFNIMRVVGITLMDARILSPTNMDEDDVETVVTQVGCEH